MLKSPPLLREQVRDRILEMIRDTPMSPGDRLLPEKKLGKLLQVDDQTVRVALAELATRGVVRRIPRNGTFYTGIAPATDDEAQTTDSTLVAVMLYTADHFYTEFQQHILAALHEDGFIPAAFCPLYCRNQKHPPESLKRFFDWNARSLVVMQEEVEDNFGFHEAFVANADRYDRIIRLLSFPAAGDVPPYPGHHLAADFASAYHDAVVRFQADGHRDIAFVCAAPRDDIPQMRPRIRQALRLYTDAMFDAGLSCNIRVFAALPEAELRRKIREALSQSHPPTAFIGIDDYRCVIVLEEAMALGLQPDRVPAVVGFLKTPWSRQYGFPSYHLRMDEFVLRLRELMRCKRLREGTTLVPFGRVEPGDSDPVTASA